MTDWQTKKLGDIGVFTKGAGIPKDSAQSGELPAVRYGELYTSFDVFVKNTKSHIDQETASASVKIKKGDILFAGSGETIDEIGKSAVYQLDSEGYAGGDIVILRPDASQDSSFLGYALNSEMARRELRKIGQGQSVVHVYRKDLETLSLALPEKSEQERIVGVLEVWDECIEKLEQKIALKERLKKGLMQQLLTGKRRLPGFDGAWNDLTLGELGVCIRGVSYDPKSDLRDTDTGSSVRLLRSNNVQDGEVIFSNIQIVDESRVKDKQLLRDGDLIVCMANGSKRLVGKSAVFAKEDILYTVGAFMGIFRPNSSVASGFVRYLFATARYSYYIASTLSGSSINNLKPSDIEGMKFAIPSDKIEAQAIADCLDSASREIEALKNIKTHLSSQKKYLLQNLIAGTIRTPENLKRIEVQ